MAISNFPRDEEKKLCINYLLIKRKQFWHNIIMPENIFHIICKGGEVEYIENMF